MNETVSARRPGRPNTVTLIAALALLAPAAFAQTSLPVPVPSPRAKVEQQVGITSFSIEYSSPGVKGRKIWGALVPYDKLWRTGANAATKLEASRDFTFGGQPVKAGAYSLFTVPGKTTWTVILNSDPNAPATSPDGSKDVVKVQVKPEALATSRERLTFVFSDTTDDSTNLDLEWEKLRVRVPITVDTKAHVTAEIDKATGEAWRPHYTAARYLLDSNGDLKQALAFIDTSIGVKPTWANYWVKAQILGKTGKKADALQAAEKAQSLGKGDKLYESFFASQVETAMRGWK